MDADGTYRQTYEQIREALGDGGGTAAVVDLLHDRFEQFTWVGYYRVDGDTLALGPWCGPAATVHTRIRIGEGVCGAAAASGRTEVVDDVRADDRYLACFVSTRSEIVVPVVRNGRVVGEIDVDSDRVAAFGDRDRAFLEDVADLLAVTDDPRSDASALVDEWGRESFPASDPPGGWAGRDAPPGARVRI